MFFRLVPAVGVVGEVGEVEHGEEGGRDDELFASAGFDPE
jgi:hypothetical protein